jgi:hypothetical protein
MSIRKRDLVHFFGGAVSTGKALRISHQAVYKMRDPVPVSTERKVRRKIAKFLERAGPAR